MNITAIIAIVLGVVFTGMVATIKVQHSNNVALAAKANTALAGKKQAEAANASLAASITVATKECNDATQKFEQQHAADLAKQASLQALLAAKAKKNADQQATIKALANQAKNPTGTTFDAQCKAADKVLKDLGQWRLQ